MKNLVITGSTRGIGYSLADEFLQQGCSVTISGSSQNSVDRALHTLQQKHDAERLHGLPCNVTELAQHQALWHAAQARFGPIDIWINNAGISNPQRLMWELEPSILHDVIHVNIVGTLYGTRVAIREMLAQGRGQVYNLEGFGSRGNVRKGMSIYGTSKASITYLSKALAKELDGTVVQVGTLSPGMVMTDMVLDEFHDDPEGLERVKPIFNIIGNNVDVVARILVKKVLANKKSGARLSVMPPIKIFWRFLSQPFVRRDLFS